MRACFNVRHAESVPLAISTMNVIIAEATFSIMHTSTLEHLALLEENERDTNRLEAFSDGVIAVAITLLVLDIHVPPFNSQVTLLHELLNGSVAYLGYVTSFVVIGLFWANHHYMFKYIQRTNHTLLLINTLTLMCLVFIPFTTALLVEHFYDAYRNTAAVVYSGSLLLTSIFYNILWRYASARYRLVDQELAPSTLAQMSRRYLLSIPLYSLTVLASAIQVEISLALYIAIALIYALPLGRPQPQSRKTNGTRSETRRAT